MTEETRRSGGTMATQVGDPGEPAMVGEQMWEALRRAAAEEGLSIRALARRFELDRKTVRRCLKGGEWRPYRRAWRSDTVLAEHAEFLRERAAQVGYSAQILYQELTARHGFQGSYATVRRFVRPLRAAGQALAGTLTRFETAPGVQSQIDWGEAPVRFRIGVVKMHLFVLTLGFSRRAYYGGFPNERLGQFLEAHECAFAHFGGHTREHLYDRPRTVCQPGADGRVAWNTTFKAFADYWGFEPRLCRAYRAQTKGKVESGVKYLKGNFLPGRAFIDQHDFDEQLAEWNATVADVRIHGTTHERPIDRFERERLELIPTRAQAPFRLGTRLARRVAEDYLVSLDTNRYSVPCRLIGQSVEIERGEEAVRVFHRGTLVATRPRLAGKHQVTILPEHGPGAVARNARRLHSSPPAAPRGPFTLPEVQVRDLGVYEALLGEVAP